MSAPIAAVDPGAGIALSTSTETQRPPQLLAVAAGTPESSELLRPLEIWAREAGAVLRVAPDFPRGARALVAEPWDAVLVLLAERGTEELGWWAEAVRQAPGTPRLVALSERPSLGMAILAEKLGVVDVLTMPATPQDIRRVVERLRSATTERPVPLPDPQPETIGTYALVGQHPRMHELYKLIARVAGSTATVLIQGESGTGKEVVARSVHLHGPRAKGPFIAVNCAAIPENLLESELFGHEAGAFTGAVAQKQGRFELANRGTLFLDEIGDMSLPLQAKILRAVQEREIERVGGTNTIPVDVRVIAATNHDLKGAIAAGKFREDLYYRLAVITMMLPKLADRGNDLLLLTSHFAKVYGDRYNKKFDSISDRAVDVLRRHQWPGNVRELRNVIERAVIVATDTMIRLEHLPDHLRAAEASVEDSPLPGQGSAPLATLAAVEARHIARVLAHTAGAIGSASEILGIHRNTLTRKMKEYDL
jgi:two-component system response regulator AtoC